METSVKKEIDFDFYGKKQNQERKDFLKSRTEKYLHFKKMGLIACGSVLAITLAGFSGKAVYDSVQASTDKAIAEKEMIIKSVPKTQIIELIERERDVVKSSYAKNQILINGYANYKELVQMLNLNSSIASKSNANKKLEKDTLTLLDSDQKSIDKVVYAMAGSRDVKKEVFLSGPDMEKYTKWVSSVQNKQFMYAGGIISLNKDLNKELKFLDDTQKDIVQTVKDKIKAKDFSLDKAQNELTSQVSKDAKAEIDELKKVQSEIAGTDQKDLLTDKDIAQAQDAMTDIQKEAALKIKQDRETVEKMIASANTAPATPVQANAQNNQQYNNQNNQGNYNNNSSHWGFAEYYLLYSWMNSGSSNYNSSQTYNSGYNAGVSAQQNASRATTSAILARGSSGLYNIRTPDSYINKSMDRKPIPTVTGSNSTATRIERPNPSLLRAKMDLARNKAQQATVARKADVTRKAEVARKTEQAKSSSSSSSTKPSSFGNSASKSSSGSSSYKSSGSSSRSSSSSSSSRRK